MEMAPKYATACVEFTFAVPWLNPRTGPGLDCKAI